MSKLWLSYFVARCVHLLLPPAAAKASNHPKSQIPGRFSCFCERAENALTAYSSAIAGPRKPQIGSFGFPKSTDTRAVCVFGVVCPKRPRPLQFPLGKTKKETFGQGKSTDTRAVCGFRTRPNPDTRAVCGFPGARKRFHRLQFRISRPIFDESPGGGGGLVEGFGLPV